MWHDMFVEKVDDWIYFCIEEVKYRADLYRVNINGTGIKKLVENCSDVHIVGEHIYYSLSEYFLADSPPDEPNGIYRINLDGSNKVNICTGYCFKLYFVDDWIFYNDQRIKDSSIYKVKIDGSEKIRLNNEKCDNIVVNGDWIYFNNRSDNFKPYKIRFDGSERTKLSDMSCYEVYLENEQVCMSILIE